MAGKISFDDVYDQPDPRGYARALSRLDYEIPEHARDTFALLARSLRERAADERFSVLDLCCSYGINAALLNHDLALAELYAHYQDPALAGLATDELAAADRAFYGQHRRADAVPVVGLDAASNAVGYALRAGLLDAGSSENLEEVDPSGALCERLADVGLVTVTGGIGYITEATFERVLACSGAGTAPWIAAFTLRWVDMTAIREALERHGCTLEILRGRTFRQRRFASDEERDHALAHLRRLGLDPQGVETDGYHHAVLSVARPADEASAVGLEELLAPVL